MRALRLGAHVFVLDDSVRLWARVCEPEGRPWRFSGSDRSQCGGRGVCPWSGNQILHAGRHSQEKVWEPDTCQRVFSVGGLQDGQDMLSGERQLVGKRVCVVPGQGGCYVGKSFRERG